MGYAEMKKMGYEIEQCLLKYKKEMGKSKRAMA